MDILTAGSCGQTGEALISSGAAFNSSSADPGKTWKII